MVVNLYCQTAFLGDLFLSIPSLKYLKKKEFPLILCCRKGLGSVFKKLGLVDDFVEVDKSDPSTWNQAVEFLNGYQFETIFSPHQSFRTAWYLKKILSGNKIGFYHWWNFWAFDTRVRRPMHLPEALRQMSLITDEPLKAQLNRESHRFINPTRHRTIPLNREKIPDWASMSVRDRVRDWKPPIRGSHIFLAPGSVWATKCWDKYTLLARSLLEASYHVALVGSPSEIEIGRKIQNEVPDVDNFIGQWDLDELLSALSHGQCLVANDSGMAHMAAAVDLPIVSIFGPTTLSLGYRPWSHSSIVVQKELGCRPCGKHGGQVCPIGTHECMKELPVQWVLESLLQLQTLGTGE